MLFLDCTSLIYFVPVLPNPPATLSVSESSDTSLYSTFAYGATTSCAILSPSSTVLKAAIVLQ